MKVIKGMKRGEDQVVVDNSFTVGAGREKPEGEAVAKFWAYGEDGRDWYVHLTREELEQALARLNEFDN